MFRILESQAPAKQNAEDTISVLSTRLQSATLLEDRRAAILGLRSFAKLYPASVASGALRSLISSLSKDAEDVDTAKVILETLLMLFNPDNSSPEASDDIALWLADEFTQRQANITVLLDLLDKHDFYSRLYSLQLISAISSARPERTQECVYTAPLGVSRLVAVLDDKREAVRSEGLLLLTALTPSSPDLQKLVAFENAFDRIFNIIAAEGSLSHGGIVVQDCLSLLANLLRLNISNQSYFRETGWVSQLARLLKEVVQEQDPQIGVARWAEPHGDKNVWGLLAVIRLFFLRGSVGTQANQVSFWQNGVLVQILEIAFHPTMDVAIKAEALISCADLIRGNSSLQEGFAQRTVPSPTELISDHRTNGHVQVPPRPRVNVIQGLLDVALTTSSNQEFDIRLSACECIKAYLYGHGPIRLHFLQRARDGHLSNEKEPDNILSILIQSPEINRGTDPYRYWIAAVLLFHLLYEDYSTKELAMSVAEGDSENGEEVVTCIQAMSGNLISGAQKGDDPRTTVGYLMVLSGWLFEDPDAINDFLGEGSNVQGLIQLAVQTNYENILVSGLCTFLLGIIYEFSTKDSPLPRTTLHQILSKSFGREQYIDKLTRLRENAMIRDFEVLHQGFSPNKLGGLPDVYFDKTFVDFLKDNFSRVIRSIDRDPGIEIPVIANGMQKGVSRELVDMLKAEVADKTQALQKSESDILTLERKLGQEQADHRKAKESATIEVNRIRNVNTGLQKNHDEELRKMQREAAEAQARVERAHQETVSKLEVAVAKEREDAAATMARAQTRHEAEMDDLKSTVRRLEAEIAKSSKDHLQDLQTAHEEYSSRESALESRLKRAEERAEEYRATATEARREAESKENARVSVQTELDDLLIVFGDLEEKRSRDKQRLKSLGEPISDGEDESDTENKE